MSDLQKEIDLLKARLDELEGRNKCEAGAPTVMQWQPKGGDWYVHGEGEVSESDSSAGSMKFGTERATQEKAQRAAVEMRRFNRLLALRDELCGDEVVDWGTMTGKFIVYFSHHKSKWLFSRFEDRQDVAVHFVCLESAQKAADMLNSGEVEL